MKIALVFCAIVAVAIGAPTVTKPDDFRNEFDRLLIISINQRLADTEQFLARLTHQLAELEKNKSKELKQQILLEIDVAINFVEGAKVHLERELKRADLNFLEKFNLDEVVATTAVLTKDLNEVAKKVKSIETDTVDQCVDETADDGFRNEFDRLLIAMTIEHFAKLEQNIEHLSHQVTELEQSKSKTLKTEILREISIALDFVDTAIVHLERELKRTDFNPIEKFNFEYALATSQVLHRDLNQLATKVKTIATK